MNRNRLSPLNSFFVSTVVLAVILTCAAINSSGQTSGNASRTGREDGAQADNSKDEQIFDDIYRRFYASYRLGSGDEISLRIKGQPEPYSMEKVKITPGGTIYHVLLGEVSLAGLTVNEAKERLTDDLNEYLKNPEVSVQLIEAVSAKIAVLGDVKRPDVYVMVRPMRVLDAIALAGGVADTGSSTSVEVSRQMSDGIRRTKKVNVKKILEGKGNPDENLALQGGDMVFVPGNAKKTIATITTLAGFGNFLSFITFGRR
jgi:polysaccharide export outer membrane protein